MIEEFEVFYPGYPLRPGYELWGWKVSDEYCGDCARMIVELRHGNKILYTMDSCSCGRGCGGGDCVTDWHGAHDTCLEMFRDDIYHPKSPARIRRDRMMARRAHVRRPLRYWEAKT